MNNHPRPWLDYALLSLVTILTYGVLVPQLGFYRDDWYLLWNARAGGANAIRELFQSDRPLIGYLYAWGYQLLRDSPLAWHLYALVARLIANLSFLWLVRQIWTRQQLETLAISLLFSVYPGFASQPNAGVYVNLLLANAAAVLSFALAVRAVNSTSRVARSLVTVTSLALALLYLGIFESMIGLEAARPALIAFLLWRNKAPGSKWNWADLLRSSLPYLLLALGFAWWRLFIFQSTRHATNLGLVLGDLMAVPLRSGVAIVVETIKDSLEATFLAWAVPFYQFTSKATYRDLATAVLVAFLALALVALRLRLLRTSAKEGARLTSREITATILLGAWTTFIVLLPMNIAGRNVLFEGQWDRYALPAAMGAVLVLGALLGRYVDAQARPAILFGLLAMSIITHYFSAAWYRDFWTSTRTLWWQMIWRAPSLERGTMLFVPASEYAEGYEIYGPANLIYYPTDQSLQVGAEVLNAETAAYILAQRDREHYDRSTLVPDNYDQPLLALFPQDGSCLHVIDGRAIELPGLVDNTLVSSVALRSRIEMIKVGDSEPAVPRFLGREPEHGWCYYYQRIQLARQRLDWVQVADLMDEAQAQDLLPRDHSEWMSALEAYVVLDRLKDARHAASIVRIDLPTRLYLCSEWSRDITFLAADDLETIRGLLCGQLG